MKKLAEAALFMASQPLTLDELTKVMGASSFAESLKVLDDLINEYKKRDSAIEIVKTKDNRYHMRVKLDYADKVSHLALSPDFSKAVLRTLGLIAVKQPVKQSIVVRIIGNKAYNYIKELIDRGFVKAKKSGSTKVLTVTPLFEDYFGKDIESIKKSLKLSKDDV